MEKTLVIEYFSPISEGQISKAIFETERAVLNGFEKVVILIASEGGETSAGFKGYNYLKSLNEKIRLITYNIGFVESAAISLYCAGAERYAVPTSHFLIHQARRSYFRWTPDEMENAINSLREDNKRSISIIAENVMHSKRKVQTEYESGVILSPEEAEKWGLINTGNNGINDDYYSVIGDNCKYLTIYE